MSPAIQTKLRGLQKAAHSPAIEVPASVRQILDNVVTELLETNPTDLDVGVAMYLAMKSIVADGSLMHRDPKPILNRIHDIFEDIQSISRHN